METQNQKEIYQDGPCYRLDQGLETAPETAERIQSWSYDYSTSRTIAILKLMRQEGKFFLFYYPQMSDWLVYGLEISKETARELENADKHRALSIAHRVNGEW